MSRLLRLTLPLLGVTLAMSAHAAPPPLLPAVEAQELVYNYTPANNGAGPLWCYGSTCLARVGDRLFVSGLETLPDQKPLNNCRWVLYERTKQGWQRVQADEKGRQREPCPLAVAQDGRLFLSSNPTLTAPGTYNGSAQPTVLQFATKTPAAPPKAELPSWTNPPNFSEHSYRGFCGDGKTGEMLLFNIWMYDLYYWSFRDRSGQWSHNGKLPFPMGVEYEEPHPIRICYPEMALRNRQVHVMGVSDITEPVKAWREYKLILNEGRAWDYDFRRLFYTWTPDITTTPFQQWVEIASCEKTCGHITNLDLWLDKQDRAHVLWLEQSVWNPKVRDKFFPEVPLTYSLHYGIVDKGKVVMSRQLLIGGEGQSKLIPGYARLHATPDGRLFCFYYTYGAEENGQPVNENRIMELFPDGHHSEPVRVPLSEPFTSFMTATERGGSLPSNTLEVLGQSGATPAMSYARLSLLNPVLADFTTTVTRTPEGSLLALDASPSRTASGKVQACAWEVGGAKLSGAKVSVPQKHGGAVLVKLTVKDAAGHSHSTSRSVNLPPAPYDLGLKQWGLVLRTEAEGFSREGGGEIHVRTDKLNASGLSLSHWNTKDHWLEWEFSVPQEDDYCLLTRYATPENATRALTLDGQEQRPYRFRNSGGYGSDVADNWALALYADAQGKPVAVHLTAGRHVLRLTNPDGTGLNLDSLDWVARTLSVPATGAAAGGRLVDDQGYRYVLPLSGTIAPSRMRAEIGHCFTTILGKQYPGESLSKTLPTLRLFEDDRELGPARVAHVEIREQGNGRFSHWGEALYFSSSDNTDPRTNGRVYRWQITEP